MGSGKIRTNLQIGLKKYSKNAESSPADGYQQDIGHLILDICSIV